MKRRRLWLGLLVAFGAGALPTLGRASEAMADAPSVFTYAGRGFLVGGMVGLSGGYLVARQDGWHGGDDWQPLAYGTGIGALAGGALGLTLGIVDMSRNTPGYGAVILRDTVYGTAFGAAAGGLVGTLTYIGSKHGEDVLLGASVGALVGAAAGVVLGIVEGNHALAHARMAAEPPFTIALAPTVGPDGHLVWMPTFGGHY